MTTTNDPARAELARLATPRFSRFAAGLAADWAVIVALFVLVRRVDHWAAYALAVAILGTRQHALGILGHDGAHRLAARRRWINNPVTQLFTMWPLATDMNAYRHFHFPHHAFLNTPRDPEMYYRRLGDPEWDLPRTTAGIAWRFARDMVGLGAFEVLRVLYSVRPRRWREAAGPLLTFALAGAAAAVTGSLWIVGLWLAAMFTSFVAVWRLRCWLEHLGTDDTHRLWLPPWFAWIVAPHNVYMHWEHHKWPAIPYWNLPRARALDTTVPILSLGDLCRLFDRSQAIKSGTPTLDAAGTSLLETS
jgi:fatty acid desaturase